MSRYGSERSSFYEDSQERHPPRKKQCDRKNAKNRSRVYCAQGAAQNAQLGVKRGEKKEDERREKEAEVVELCVEKRGLIANAAMARVMKAPRKTSLAKSTTPPAASPLPPLLCS
ncbi:hypothetical protein HZH66_003815 [Vespula vulgaris]|uniref:Uncharacterized protein n=1 Tax=Vespula vulgaris TaxID=7454 RepID=A0A834KHK5_VESVU|nr:hypothetical protein HZH66_003815 [Vespula vulgaris]